MLSRGARAQIEAEIESFTTVQTVVVVFLSGQGCLADAADVLGCFRP